MLPVWKAYTDAIMEYVMQARAAEIRFAMPIALEDSAAILASACSGYQDATADELVERSQRRMSSPEPNAPSKPDDVTLILFRPT